MWKQRRWAITLTLVVMMMSLVLGACTSNKGGNNASPSSAAPTSSSASPSESSEAPKENVEIQFWTISLSPNFDDYINGRIDKFESENPNVKVKWTDLPISAIESRLLTSIAGGNAPDVVNLNTPMALKLASKNALVDLQQEATDEQRGIYFEKMFDATKLGEGRYAFPWYLGLNVLMYNKQIYEEAGLDPTKPPKTWDEVVEQAKQIRAKTKKYPFVYSEHTTADLAAHGVPILSADKKKIEIDTPEALAHAKWVKSLYDQDLIPKDAIQTGYAYNIDQYLAGQMAMLLTGPQFLNRVKENAPDVYKNTLVAEVPTAQPNGPIPAPLMNVVVPKLSQHHPEAIAFANFITNDESQLEFAKVVNILPSTKKAAEDPFFTTEGDDPESKAKVLTAKELSRGFDFSLGLPREEDLYKALDDEWKKMLLGEQTPEEMLKKATENMQKILDEINNSF